MLNSLIATVDSIGPWAKDIFLAVGAGLAVWWTLRDRRRKVTLQKLDITAKAQKVISDHVDTMDRLSTSVNVMRERMRELEETEATCQKRLALLERQHGECNAEIAYLQRRMRHLGG